MPRKIGYWSSTAIVAVALLGSLTYLTGSEQVVSGFAKAGYPQYLRIVLGIAKPAAAIVLLLPGLPLLKEWAYAGVTFALVMATISAYSIGETWALPLVLLGLLTVSYLTRPASRRLMASVAMVLIVGFVLAPAVLRAQDSTDMRPPLEIGASAPDFSLPGATRYGVLGKPVRLSDFKGKTVMLAFFYKARTGG